MIDEEYRRYFEMLELPPDASLSEVKSAYQQLREIYSTNSIALSSIEDEFPESSRQKVLQQLEEVYKKLLVFFENEEKGGRQRPVEPASVGVADVIRQVDSFTGPILRQIREMRGVELHEVSLATKIRKGYLHDLEMENFSNLPSEIYLKGYLVSYAQYLSLDQRKVTEDYMKRYNEWARTRRL